MNEPALLKRTTFLCRDAARLADFYCAVFAMRRWYDHTLPVDHRFPPTGLPDGAQAKLIICQAQDDAVGMLGLLQYLDPTLEPAGPPADRLRAGDPVLVWNVADVDSVHVRAIAAGARIATAPTVWEVPARQGGPATRLKMMALFDPEGRYSEVSQRV